VNLRRLCLFVATSSLCVWLAGCATESYSPLAASAPGSEATPPPEPVPEMVVITNLEPAVVVGLDDVEGRLPLVTAPPSAPTNTVVVPTPTPTPVAPDFGRGWMPLRRWTERYGLGPMEKTVSGTTNSYRMATRRGVLKLTIGSRIAQWDGTVFWLGFAPQFIKGEPHIQALDAEKSLFPLAENLPALRSDARIVVLDPGHGGMDGGTRGAKSQLEKNYSLDWALRTEHLLTNAGWKVFLTRRSDVDVSLAERVAFAERVQADVFISLHFNSTFPQTQSSGIETYCLTPSGMPSTLARGYPDDVRISYPNNRFDTANLALAFRAQNLLLKETHARDGGVKRARFMGVLRFQNRPAILIEGGFLSNPREAAAIQSGAYRETLAQAVAAILTGH
jgi:N-acetylmuramoyl-L-alanine amidase